MSVTEVVNLTRELIQIPSENPTGNELACARYIESWLRRINGIEVSVHEVEEGRCNIIAAYHSSMKTSRPLVFIGHMDTVPVEGDWTYHPFGGQIVDGKLYGRGACDMKSGLACALIALKNLAEAKVELERDVVVIASIDEEGPYMKGAVALEKEHLIPEDALLVAMEPTSLTMSTSHKGTIWYELNVEGKSSHGGNAHLGADAVHAASEVISRLKQQVAALPYDHPIFGKPAISVGSIRGGHKTNMVAGSCRVELDFRLVPPMTKEEANAIMKACVREGCESVPGTKALIKHYGWQRPPIETDADSPLVKMLAQSYEKVKDERIKETGFPAYTDVSMISLRNGNKDIIVFGPGDLDQAHAVDEYVEIDQLEVCTEVLMELARSQE
ncbi:M20 family metallopeptidase [Alkalihalophilus marmarensis]|uniref:M20 family metallopeptidase n=1 Tax=Alkalihalophilus marmarensis TaxID=521377 RepID=UPI002E240399|nr:M20 family metallopeptidase [Alkalihalophilus marmarensis]